jgi:hypothetical protein
MVTGIALIVLRSKQVKWNVKLIKPGYCNSNSFDELAIEHLAVSERHAAA